MVDGCLSDDKKIRLHSWKCFQKLTDVISGDNEERERERAKYKQTLELSSSKNFQVIKTFDKFKNFAVGIFLELLISCFFTLTWTQGPWEKIAWESKGSCSKSFLQQFYVAGMNEGETKWVAAMFAFGSHGRHATLRWAQRMVDPVSYC